MKLVYKIAIAFFCVSAWGSPIYCNAQDTLGINVIERYTLQQVPPSEHFKDNDYSKRFFVQLQTGSSFFLNGISKEKTFKNNSFNLGASAGYWYTPIHGVRSGIGMHFFRGKESGNSFNWQTDYLLNLSALAKGYNPQRFFELVATVGPEAILFDRPDKEEISFGLRGGMQARFRANEYSVFFIEPSVGIYSDHYNLSTSWRKYDLGGSITAGLEFHPAPTQFRHHDSFSSEKFSNGLFVMGAVGGGFRFKYKEDKVLSQMVRNNLGGVALVGVGKWFNAYSGMRVSARFQAFRNRGEVVKKRYEGLGLQGDYLLNLSNAFGGYRTDRHLQWYLPAGLNYDYTNQQEAPKNQLGLGAGIQAAFKIFPHLEYFIEPRFNFYPIGQAHGYTAIKSDVNFMVTTGVNFTGNNGQPHSSNAVIQKTTPKWKTADHLFAGIYGDWSVPVLGTHFYEGHKNFKGGVQIGTWFSPYLGTRLYTEMGYSYRSLHKSSIKSGSFGGDILWNISQTILGYQQDRRFEMIAGAGLNLLAFNSKLSPSYLGKSISIQALWHLNSTTSLFIEPKLRIYSDKMAQGRIDLLKSDGVSSISTGLNIHFKPSTVLENIRKRFGNEQFENRILYVSGGLQGIVQDMKGAGPVGEIMLGRWRNPAFGWRAGFIFENHKERGRNKNFNGVGADWLFNLSTFAAGYDPDRKFNFIGLAGIQAGIDPFAEKTRAIIGIRGGIQATASLSDNIAVYLQPQLTLRTERKANENIRTLLPGLQLGISYKGNASKAKLTSKEKGKRFVSTSYGLGLYSGTIKAKDVNDKFHNVTRVAVGQWLSPLSGVRLSYTYKDPDSRRTKRTITNHAIGLDYLLDISSLLLGADETRKVDVIGTLGGTLNFDSQPKNESTTQLGARAGLQLRYHASEKVTLFAESSINMYGKHYEPGTHKAAETAELEAGISYNF